MVFSMRSALYSSPKLRSGFVTSLRSAVRLRIVIPTQGAEGWGATSNCAGPRHG